MKRSTLFAVTASAVILVLSSAIFLSAQEDKVRIAHLPVMSAMPYFVAQEKGFFDKYGIDAELIQFNSSNHIGEAVASGRADVGHGSVIVYLTMGAVEPGKVKVWMTGNESNSVEGWMNRLVVRNDEGIEKISDLKGKRIGTFPGVTTTAQFKVILKANGVDPETEAELMRLSPSIQVQAMETGQVDALFTLEPRPTQCVLRGFGKIFPGSLLATYITDPFVSGCYAFSGGFLEKNPDAAKRFVKAVLEARDWIAANDAEAREILLKYIPIEKDVAMQAGFYRFVEISPDNIRNLQNSIEFYNEHEILPKSYDAGDVCVSEEFMEEVSSGR